MNEPKPLAQGLADAIVAASPDCIKLLSADGTLLFMNGPGIEQNQIGCIDGIIGKPLVDIWPVEERDKLNAAIAEAAAGRPSHMEGYCPTEKGEPRWWDVRFAPFQGSDDNREISIVGVSRDISSRRTSQFGLPPIEPIDPSSQPGMLGAWTLELGTGDFASSASCRTNYGRPPDQPFTYEDIAEATHPDDRDRRAAAVDRTIATGQPLDIEYRILTPDQRLRWIQIRGEAVADDMGNIVRLQGVSLDVTERANADIRRSALIELNDRFRTTEDPADLAFIAAEILGRTLGVSRAGYGTIDKLNETIDIERDWNAPGVTSLAGRLHFRDYGTYIDNLKRGETVAIADVRLDDRTSKGADGLIAIKARSFINMPVTELGQFVALIYVNNASPRDWSEEDLIFMRDLAERTRVVVERRRVEEEVKDLNASLEARIAERSRELEEAHDALRQSQKMEAVGQLTGGLAHDFNNLLTGILGNLELLQLRVSQGRLDSVDRFVNAAQGAGRRAAALTQRLLAFSRRQTLDPKPTDINKLVGGMEEMIRRTVGPGVHVEVVGAAGLWPAIIDAGQLENALLNLCINARDAMPDGGRLTIETANKWIDDRSGKERDLSPGQYLSVCVTDTGTGMTPETIARAFDPFFTTKPIGEGTGLGLSMIYGFARQSGGQVRIYSEVGKGTTMCIYLPRYLGELEEPVAVAAQTRLTGGSGETILVVDDEPTIRHLIDEVLDDLGYTVIGVADGAAGLKVLQSGARIDLLITDVGLPNGMNGRQVADAARSLRPGLKILFITGYAENAAVGNGHMEAGMELLTKPFSMDHLAQRVRDIVQSQGHSRG